MFSNWARSFSETRGLVPIQPSYHQEYRCSWWLVRFRFRTFSGWTGLHCQAAWAWPCLLCSAKPSVNGTEKRIWESKRKYCFESSNRTHFLHRLCCFTYWDVFTGQRSDLHLWTKFLPNGDGQSSCRWEKIERCWLWLCTSLVSFRWKTVSRWVPGWVVKASEVWEPNTIDYGEGP